MKDILVFSTNKFKEFVRAHYDEKVTEIVLKDSKEWTEECEGLTPEEVGEHGFMYDNAWFVKKSELVCKALSEWLKATIIVRKNKHGITFNYAETKKTIISLNYNLLNITVQLPPPLITMIGRFYEKAGEN